MVIDDVNVIKGQNHEIMINHPKFVTFGIGLAITFVIGTAIGE